MQKQLALKLTHDAQKFLDTLPEKHFCQIYDNVKTLLVNPQPQDSRQLKGQGGKVFFRKDSGEYRIVYTFDETCLNIYVIGKRNDGDVYKKLKRL